MDFGVNQALVEEQFTRYRENPRAVAESWRRYFEGLSDEDLASLGGAFTLGVPERINGNGTLVGMPAPVPPPTNGKRPVLAEELSMSIAPGPAPRGAGRDMRDAQTMREYQERVTALVQGYRMRGHRFANLDPLGLYKPDQNELSLERFGLADVDPATMFATGNFGHEGQLPLGEIVRRLRETYTRTIGVEFRNIEEPEVRSWFQEKMEPSCNRLELTPDEQLRILTKLIDAEIFEQFLHTKFVGAKRFSLEGAESVIPLMELVIGECGTYGIEEMVIGMAHRGRLNVLANVMEKSLQELFAAFDDENPEAKIGKGDVKYHLGQSSDRITPAGTPIHLTLAFNPSHLEFVNPVVEGRVRAKQNRRGDTDRRTVLPLLIHGDAAVIGQGIVQETINLSQLPGYATGGTVHVVINNQIGFTTVWQDARSTRYCTDIFRMLRCPIFHVNGEDPEAVAQVVKIAMEYRQRYARDVVIDVYCYRRHGHNETDEPRFTQPSMYHAIDKKPSVKEIYIQRLIELGSITRQQAEEIERARRTMLDQALTETREKKFVLPPNSMQGLWAGYSGGKDPDTPEADTRVAADRLNELMEAACRVPSDFHVHPKLEKLLEARREMGEGKRPFDWGGAEILAFASLVAEGYPVRLSGQDARRGTFSHRHAVLYDHVDGHRYTPLGHYADNQARFEVWDSPLSEAGVLGFEYGYSLDYPDGLVIWEAQFGDFFNGAQVIIDQFLSSSEDKWYRMSGLVMLLPHGFEGQGPEHSSARLERWLNLCAEHNMQICNLTTPAQFFHVLRRQVLRRYRKPLIIMSPKSLLRLPAASSELHELSTGSFRRIIPDTTVDPRKVKRVLMCSGKIYYELAAARRERNREDIAIIRMEQLYPMSPELLRDVLAPYKDGTPLVWVQEEPWNMGAWYYIRARLPTAIDQRLPLECASRPESAAPATGSAAAHKIEQARLIERALG